MHNKSHDKKHPPIGFPFENDAEMIKKNSISYNTDTRIPKFHGTSDNQSRFNNNPLMIRRAYSEPVGFDMVENMLLQRDYIID